jgi:hypothetical protein
MATKYWFRPKRFGYGATPVTWQGWLFTLGTALAMVAVTLFLLRLTERHLWFLAVLVAFNVSAIGALVIVCRRKTDGEWRWRWGDRD